MSIQLHNNVWVPGMIVAALLSIEGAFCSLE